MLNEQHDMTVMVEWKYSSINKALDGGELSHSRPGHVIPYAHWTKGWADALDKTTTLHLPEIELRFLELSARSLVTLLTTLYDFLVCYMKNVLQ